MMKMPRQTGAFPPVNNLLQKKLNERAYKQHLEKRKSMKAGLNTKQPKSYLHLQLNLKKIQLEEERQEAIDHENRILLAKLTNVIRSPGQLDNWNEEYDELPKSLNRPQMLREQERIAAENLKISKRLSNVTAEYNTDQWEDDYLLHEYYLTLKAQETKGFEVDTRGFEDDVPHYYNKDLESSTASGSSHPSDGSQTDNDTQTDQLTSSPPSTCKTTKTTPQKKGAGAFRRPKPLPKLPLLGPSRKKEEEKKKREAASRPAPYNDRKDAARLFKAIKEMGKPEAAVIHALARRTYSQRQNTKELFEKQYELDLEEELTETLSEEWTDLVSVLLAKRETIDASTLHQALKGELPMTDTVIGLLCTRNNSAISVIKKTYLNLYGSQLADDIKDETKGQLRHLFLTLAKGIRMEGTEVNPDRAKQDAEVLRTEPVAERWKVETGKMAELLRVASFSQIREVLEQYEQLYETRVMDEFQQHLAGDFRDAMQAMVKCLYHCAMYMAERHRVNLVRRNSPSLIRLLVTRSEIDMVAIRKAYRQRYGETLMDAIESICREPYKRALINMVLVHGAVLNQQDQQEMESRGAFSATKVPSLPKVASPPQKPKSFRRPSPNKTATLKSSNPLLKSVKGIQQQQQQQQQQQAKDSILVSRRPGAVPKKSVTVLDPRAKQTPPSTSSRGSSKTKRPTSKPTPSSLEKGSRKASADYRKEERGEEGRAARDPPSTVETAQEAAGGAGAGPTQERADSAQDAPPPASLGKGSASGGRAATAVEGVAAEGVAPATPVSDSKATTPGVADEKGTAPGNEKGAGQADKETEAGLARSGGNETPTTGQDESKEGGGEKTAEKEEANSDTTPQADGKAEVRAENPDPAGTSGETDEQAPEAAAASEQSPESEETGHQT